MHVHVCVHNIFLTAPLPTYMYSYSTYIKNFCILCSCVKRFVSIQYAWKVCCDRNFIRHGLLLHYIGCILRKGRSQVSVLFSVCINVLVYMLYFVATFGSTWCLVKCQNVKMLWEYNKTDSHTTETVKEIDSNGVFDFWGQIKCFVQEIVSMVSFVLFLNTPLKIIILSSCKMCCSCHEYMSLVVLFERAIANESLERNF